MSTSQGKEKRAKTGRRPRETPPHDDEPALSSDIDDSADFEAELGGLPEFIRKALQLGLSTFFVTESAIRKAVGDTLPKDWLDFAVEQSERTRSELIERMSFELSRSIENIDLASVTERLLEGRTLEIKAEISLSPKRTTRKRRPSEGRGNSTRLRVTVTDDDFQ